tara:strand:- start:1210 stop:2100 length:891 start_codon:yes stop_codon:yes gene_type:complete
MEKQIFWLASYPKSGNTLLRFILISLFFTKDGVFSFKDSKFISQFESTINVIRNKSIFGNDFENIGDINIFYKYILELQTKKSLGFKEDFIFLKTHSGLFKINENPFTVVNNTRGIIYIIRDPRDVSISWSKHNGVTIDKSIDFMNNDYSNYMWPSLEKNKNLFSKKTNPRTLMSSWEKNVLSWVSLKWDVPILIIKYEDLVYDKLNSLKKIVDFFVNNYKFKFDNLEIKLNNIIKSTEFKILKKYEEKNGFLEATEHNQFFSVGKKNQWKKVLSENQIKKIEEKSQKVMKKFNYK